MAGERTSPLPSRSSLGNGTGTATQPMRLKPPVSLGYRYGLPNLYPTKTRTRATAFDQSPLETASTRFNVGVFLSNTTLEDEHSGSFLSVSTSLYPPPPQLPCWPLENSSRDRARKGEMSGASTLSPIMVCISSKTLIIYTNNPLYYLQATHFNIEEGSSPRQQHDQ